MEGITVERLVFVDESIFKKQTGWRGYTYGPIGSLSRYHRDLDRGKTWVILPAYTTAGYLPCTAVKKDYFSTDQFRKWVIYELLPYCNTQSVIVIDNASFHTHPSIAEAIYAKGCLVKFLPPYSPNYNLIEMTFHILKAWIRRNWRERWPIFEGDFGQFLRLAIIESGYDYFPTQYFKHAGQGVLNNVNWSAISQELFR